jgi:hypothetical protein
MTSQLLSSGSWPTRSGLDRRATAARYVLECARDDPTLQLPLPTESSLSMPWNILSVYVVQAWSTLRVIYPSPRHISREGCTQRVARPTRRHLCQHRSCLAHCNHLAFTPRYSANSLLTDPQDSLRWPTRRMHALRAEQNAMSDNGPYHWTRHSTRSCRGHGVGEHVLAQTDSRATRTTEGEWRRAASPASV